MSKNLTPQEYRDERLKRGLTQGKLADLVGVSRITISGRETGRDRFPISSEASKAIQSLPKPKIKTNDDNSN